MTTRTAVTVADSSQLAPVTSGTITSETENVRSMLKSIASALDLLGDDLTHILRPVVPDDAADGGKPDFSSYPYAVEELAVARAEARVILDRINGLRDRLAIK